MDDREIQAPDGTAPGARRGPGRPPLTERRKTAARMEIAYEAIQLFTNKGVAATSADEIADAVGISTRTLRRYFPTKESCVQPLLAVGLARVMAALGARQSDQTINRIVDVVIGREPESGLPSCNMEMTLALIRLTRAEPPLRAVWLEFQHDNEHAIAEVLAEIAGASAGDLPIKIKASMIIAALRTAVEHVAEHSPNDAPEHLDADALWAATRTALSTAVEGVGTQ
ncbi:TetR/AcrR family transcriptional regulator [Streptomyces scabiei]|uniref:TetR/AcrR family transcriptional regulator n=1 Tax=Streptomyces scabiei TaxID=1930 RepID=UPI0036AD00CB